MTQLAFYFAADMHHSVSLIVMTKGDRFYGIPRNVSIIEPDFSHKQYSPAWGAWKILKFVRGHLKALRPDAVLSFGGKYNAFVLIAVFGLGLKVFISERSRPGISYGRLLDIINPLVYRTSYGIIAQTERARDHYARSIRHNNVAVIGNPIRAIGDNDIEKENIILNVGRFIRSKNQILLIEYFSKVVHDDWQLVFLGDGEHMREAIEKAQELGVVEKVVFVGNEKNIDLYYQRSKIFAFTSVSEGFPNALAEAMSAGLACISFDCIAGPSELIDNGTNGYLVPLQEDVTYIGRLALLMKDEELRKSFGLNARHKMNRYRVEEIGQRFVDFMFAERERV